MGGGGGEVAATVAGGDVAGGSVIGGTIAGATVGATVVVGRKVVAGCAVVAGSVAATVSRSATGAMEAGGLVVVDADAGPVLSFGTRAPIPRSTATGALIFAHNGQRLYPRHARLVSPVEAGVSDGGGSGPDDLRPSIRGSTLRLPTLGEAGPTGECSPRRQPFRQRFVGRIEPVSLVCEHPLFPALLWAKAEEIAARKRSCVSIL